MSLEYQCICGACEDCLSAIERHEDRVIRTARSSSTPPSPMETLSPEDILNEFEYVLENAPDEASRTEARGVALGRIRLIQEAARLEGFRKFERMHFDD